MVQITKVLSDYTVMTPMAAPLVRTRTLVLLGRKLKPFTTLNLFFASQNINSFFTPCSKVIITSTYTFAGYGVDKQSSDIGLRTTTVASYDVLDKGDVITCTTGSAVVVSHEQIYNISTGLSENVLYVTNIKGTLSGAIKNTQSTASGTVVSVAAGSLVSNSRGNIYGSLIIPSNTFPAGTAKILFSDSTDPASSTSSTFAEGKYIAQGRTETFDRYLNTQTYNYNVVKKVVERVRYVQLDPLAETFTVPKEFDEGVFITSVDIFIASGNSGDQNPIIVQIVETENGYPTQTILPWAQSALYYPDLNISGTSLAPTRFYFENLVFLEPNKEYAIKLLTNSTTYRVWTSFIGDEILNNPGRIISQQPFLGSFFKSQNNSTWTPEQLQDLTFNLNYAKFNTGVIGKVKLVENITSVYHTLPPNPFKITNGRTKVSVHHPGHGFAAGLVVAFSGSSISAFNNTFTITTVVDSDNYIITTSSQTSTDLVGGNAVKAEKSIKYDSLMFSGTQEGRSAGIKVTATLSGATSIDTVDTDIVPDVKTDLMVNKYLHTSLNKSTFLQSSPSLQVKLELSSTNSAISPVINLDKVGIGLFGSKINSPVSSAVDYDIDGNTIVVGSSNVSFTATTNIITIPSTTDYTQIKVGAWIKIVDSGGSNDGKTGYISLIDTTNNQLTIVGDALATQASRSATIIQYLTYVSETSNGGTAESKYITKQVNLQNPSSGFRVIFEANIPTEADINMYYRTGINSSTDMLSNKSWINNPIAYKKSTTEIEFTEFEYNITDLSHFDTFQFKFVLLSTNTAVTPKVRKLRIIAHA